jgi:hypothetical protein
MRPHGDFDQRIARRAAADPRLPFAAQAQDLAVARAGWNGDSVAARSSLSRTLCRRPSRGKPMTRNFIFAHDVILDPDTAKIVAVVRNGEVWRYGVRIAVLVGAHIYDLNGNLLGKLAEDTGSLPISFKNLVEGKSAHAERALVA